MGGRRLLALAQKLLAGVASGAALTPGDGAPEYRSAISRAYYAAFLVSGAYLDRIGFAVETTPAAHVAVQHAFNNSGEAVLRKVSADLRDLSAHRRRADYDMKDPAPAELTFAARCVRLAADVIAWLDDVRDSAGPERTGAVAVAVSRWLRSAQNAGLRQKSGTG